MSPRLAVTAIVAFCVAVVAVSVAAVWIALIPADRGTTTAEVAGVVPSSVGGPVTLPSAEPSQGSEEKSEAGAKAAAQLAFDTYSSGDYGGFWDRWSTASQQMISRADYERMHELCRPIAQGVRYTIQAVRLEGDVAKVQATMMIGAFTYDFVFEAGRWRYTPLPEQAAEYAKGVEQIVAEKRSKRACA